jgi:hypothetical protein
LKGLAIYVLILLSKQEIAWIEVVHPANLAKYRYLRLVFNAFFYLMWAFCYECETNSI